MTSKPRTRSPTSYANSSDGPILPLNQSAEPGGDWHGFGTAFFYTQPVGSTHDGDVVHEWLLTADPCARAAYGEVGLRPSVAEPVGAAPEAVPMPDFADRWLHRPEIGLAAMPTGWLHGDAEDQGWHWRTQQVTDAVAARADAIGQVGAEPSSAFVLALGVAADGSRPLEAAIERVVRDGDGLRVTTELPAGYVGAPVFGVEAAAGEALALRCLGLVLPGAGGGHPLATFDRIRVALAEVTAGYR